MTTERKVLIVDRDERARELSRRAFLDLNVAVETVRTAHEAIEAVSRYAIDVVLLGSSTPGIEGLSGLRVIKGRHPNMEVVVVAGAPSWQQAKEAIRLGAFDYLARPVALEKITDVVTQAAIYKKWALQQITEPTLEGEYK